MRVCRDAAEWDATVLRLSAPHVLQSEAWGAFKVRWGWRVHRFSWTDGPRTVAAAQVLTRRPTRLPFVLAYVPKGPLLDNPCDARTWGTVLADLASWALGNGVALLKIDPDVDASAAHIATEWRGAGWRPSNTPVQFANTMVTDLTVGESALMDAMHGKTRYNVRLAARRGVTVRSGGAVDLMTFYRLYAQTGARAGFGVRDPAYYLDIWRRWLDARACAVLLAERDGRALAGVMPVQFGSTAWYLYGASADEGRQHMPAFAAQWESMRWALARGCRRYDWWGGPTVLDASDAMWGVYRFKQGFGARWVEHVGAWDLPVRPIRYALFDRLERWRRRRIAAAITSTTPRAPIA